MDTSKVAQLMGELGLSGLDPTKLSAVMELLQGLGANTSVDPKQVPQYFPSIREGESFYIPKMPKGLYTGCFNSLRDLVTPRFPRLR